MVTTCTCRPARAYPAAAIAPARVLPSPVAISITSPASMRSAPNNWTSNGRSAVVLSAASLAIARNCGMSADSARSSSLSNPVALRSFSSVRPAASSSYSSEAATWAIERLRSFSVLAPSSRQNRLVRRPDCARVVFDTGQRYAGRPATPRERACLHATRRAPVGGTTRLRGNNCARSPPDRADSSEVGSARVGDARVGEHVDDGGQATGEGTFERGPQLAGRAHEFAVAPEGARHLVVACARPQLRHHRVAVQRLHRVLFQSPDPVVADHRHDGHVVPHQGVPLHAAEAECAVALQQHDLTVWPGQLGGQGITRARTEAAEGAAVQPAARQIAVDHPAGVGPEITGVDDDDGVA